MRKTARASVLLVLALLGAGPARADQASAGAQPFAFLGLDASARAAALGGADTALAVGADALQYNPAGLGLMKEHELALMHDQYFETATHDHLALALRSGFGVSADVFNYGKLNRTTYASPDSTLGQFTILDEAFAAGYGRSFGALAFGAAGKLVREKNDGIAGQAVAADLGVLASPSFAPGLRLGLAAQNLGSKVRFENEAAALPATFRAGAAWTFPVLGYTGAVTVDAAKVGTDRVRPAAGAEAVWPKGFALRLGYTTRNQAGLGVSAGVGWRGSSWAIDYAIAPYGDLGLAHRVGVALRWGALTGREASEDPIIRAALRPGPDDSAPEKALPLGPEVRMSVSPPQVKIPNADRIGKARRLIDAGRLDEARIELNAVDRELDPEDGLRESWYEAEGRYQLAKRRLPEARAAYTEALRFAIKNGEGGQTAADSYEGMGKTLAAQGDLAYAVKFLRKAYLISPAQRLLDTIEKYERRLQK
jgi:tetratricopeptide (TPR) repeat protein